MTTWIEDEGGSEGEGSDAPTWRIAIDPGLSVGIATGAIGDGTGSGVEIFALTMPWEQFWTWVQDELSDPNETEPVELVVEGYTIRPDTAQANVGNDAALTTIETIGVLRQAARVAGHTFVVQQPSIKTPVEKQLPARGIALVNGDRHSMDAQLHWWYRELTPTPATVAASWLGTGNGNHWSDLIREELLKTQRGFVMFPELLSPRHVTIDDCPGCPGCQAEEAEASKAKKK